MPVLGMKSDDRPPVLDAQPRVLESEDAVFVEDGLSREGPRWRYGLLLICALDAAVWALVVWVAWP